MISVCMTTYKGEKYREKQISSIEKNISLDDEVIVSEDGDDIVFLKDLKERGSRFLPLEGPGCGAVANFEYALSHAKGDIIFLSDQDDVWTENKVKRVLQEFENPECIMVVHDADLIDEEGVLIGDSFYAIRDSKVGIIKNIWKNSPSSLFTATNTTPNGRKRARKNTTAYSSIESRMRKKDLSALLQAKGFRG